MKKILLLLLICFAQNLFAQEVFTYGDFNYTINENNEITIIRYRGSLSSVDIPSVIDGKTVTTIGDYAFDGCKSLIIQCNSGSYAEKYCKKNNIKYLITPDGLELGNYKEKDL